LTGEIGHNHLPSWACVNTRKERPCGYKVVVSNYRWQVMFIDLLTCGKIDLMQRNYLSIMSI